MTLAVDAQLSWWISRATGIVAWAAVVAALLWGLTLSSRLMRGRGLPAWLTDSHRYFGTLALAFTAIHLGALVADNYVTFGWRELFVPMASDWKPGPVTWGILALALLAIVEVTSWMQRALSRRVWHRIHWLSVPLVAAATVHGILAGTDRSNRLLQAVMLVAGGLVLFAATFRALSPRSARRAASAAPAAADPADALGAGVRATETIVAAAAVDDERAARIAALAARRGRTPAVATVVGTPDGAGEASRADPSPPDSTADADRAARLAALAARRSASSGNRPAGDKTARVPAGR